MGVAWSSERATQPSSSSFSSFFPRPRDFVPVAPHCPGKKCARPSAGLTTSTRVFGRSRFQPNDSFMRPLSSYTAARAAHAVFRGEKPLREGGGGRQSCSPSLQIGIFSVSNNIKPFSSLLLIYFNRKYSSARK